MRAKISLLLGLFILLCVNQINDAQKLSEEDALEGSANLMSPDDEDFAESSGLPPEDEEPRKASTFKPHFVTQSNIHDVVKHPIVTESPTLDITGRPGSETADADSNHTMLYVAIAVIVAVLILLVLVIVCCRKRKTDYEPGTPRV